MSPDQFRRKSSSEPHFDTDAKNAPIYCLLRIMLGVPKGGDTQVLDELGIPSSGKFTWWEGEDYSVKEFADHANTALWNVYAWLSPDSVRHFPVQYEKEFKVFVRVKSGGKDIRLAVYDAWLSGLSVMPMNAEADKVRQILSIIEGR